MPFVLIAIGLVLLIASARGTYGTLYSLVQSDFTGPNNFIYWFISILVLGSLGYVKALRPIANVFLALVILVLFLSRGGFFAQFVSAIGTTQTAPPLAQQTPAGSSNPGGLGAQLNLGTNLLSSLLGSLGGASPIPQSNSTAPLQFPFSTSSGGPNNISPFATPTFLPTSQPSQPNTGILGTATWGT